MTIVVSSAFTVNGSLPTDAVAVAPGSTVSLALQSLTGIELVTWSIVGNDRSTRVNPTIVPAGSPPGALASFVQPADSGDGLGQAYRVQCFVSDGGKPANTSTTIEVIGSVNLVGAVPLAAGEELERDPAYGWTQPINVLSAGSPRSVTPLATTDATQTTVSSLAIPADTCAVIRARWFGRKSTATTDIARRESLLTVYRIGSGNVTQLGSTNDLLATTKTDASWGALDFALNTGTQSVDFRVQGKAATTINWSVEVYASFK